MYYLFNVQDLLSLFSIELFLIYSISLLIFFNLYYFSVTKESISTVRIEYPFKSTFFLSVLVVIYCIFLLTSGNSFGMNYNNFFFEVTLLEQIVTFFILLFLLLFFCISNEYLHKDKLYIFEYYILVFLCVLGFLLLIKSTHLMSIYLSVELISLSSYVMATIKRYSEYSSEAGLKYFALGVFGSAFLLLSSSFFYGIYGTMNLSEIFLSVQYLSVLKSFHFSLHLLTYVSIVLYVSSFLLKLGLVPFHVWVPDVYEGAPTTITLFFSSFSKLAFFIFLAKLFFISFTSYLQDLQTVFQIIGVVSVIFGTFLAIYQSKLKRLFAYSSIVHAGYLLLVLTSYNLFGFESFLFYLLLYVIMVFNLFFTIISLVSSDTLIRIKYISELGGLFRINPYLAVNITILMFSLAGIPPIIGFFSKFYVFTSLIANFHYTVAIIALLFSILGALYYIYLIRIIYFNKILNNYTIVHMSYSTAYFISSSFLFMLFGFIYLKPILSVISSLSFFCML